MNPEEISTAAFPVLTGMVITWFILIKLFFNRLERLHQKKYQAMGRPSLILRNNISGGLATFKFLFAREHKTLNDPYLSKLSDFMLVFFLVYLLLFFGLFFVFAAQVTSSAV